MRGKFPVLILNLIICLTFCGCAQNTGARDMDTGGTDAGNGETADASSGQDTSRQNDTALKEETDEAVLEYSADDTAGTRAVSFNELVKTGSMDLQYATEFQVEEYSRQPASESKDSQAEDDYVYHRILITEDDQDFLLVPEGAPTPEDLPEGMVVLSQPLDHTYLVSTSVMDYLCKLDVLDHVCLSAIKEEDWSIPAAREAMDLGYIQYGGKYNAPDYELILAEGCNLAIENTMIYHNPEVKEKLEQAGIPVIVERSSYERNPLGRLEWIRLYGVLYGKQQEADQWFSQEVEDLSEVMQEQPTGKSVAYFSVTSNGAVTIRKPGDYVSKLIDMAGGTYIFTASSLGQEEDNALSTMHLQMEQFYATAKNADYLIYNGTIEGEITTIQDLLDKNALFADFKAVKDDHVFCTGADFFQQPTGMGEFVEELHAVLTGDDSGGREYLAHVAQ